MSPARLSPTAAPSAAPGPGPTTLSSAPASHAGGCPQDPPSRPVPGPAATQPSHLPPPHSDSSVGEWVTAAGGHGRFSASFVDPSFCPFAEELRPLQLQLEGLSDTSYLNFSIYFFIRDIGELRLAAAQSGAHPRGAGPHGGAGLPHAEPRSARSAA